MSSYLPSGGYGAPQLVTVAKQPDNLAQVELLTTQPGMTTQLESLVVAMTLHDNGFTASPNAVLVLEWLDPTGNLIASYPVYMPNLD